MATATIVGPAITGSNVGQALLNVLAAADIDNGSGPGYQLCKELYLFHPLGAKIAEKPIEIAMSQKRELSVQGAGTAADKCKERFDLKWKLVNADGIIFNTASLSRVYGAAAFGLIEEGVANAKPIDFRKINKKDFSINVYDPLNVAGSLVLNLDPLSSKFLQVFGIAVSGVPFHRTRARVLLNENPVYLAYTSSAFGFVGRSVYQRALLPLKSFVQTMITDDMVSRKAGVIVAKIKQAGSIINQRMRNFLGIKRNIVLEAQVGNVISIGTENEEIESLDLKNLAEPFGAARKNIIENIASAVPMPAKMLTNESFAVGHADGTEDAREQARYVDRIREKLDPLYDWFDKLVMHLAWDEEFFYIIQAEFPEEFKDVSYDDFFWRLSNSFKAQWPNLLKEPDSELIKVDEIKLKSVIAWVEVLLPNLPQDEKAKVIMWACDQFNELKLLFGSRLELDPEAIKDFKPPEVEAQENAHVPEPFRNDSLEQLHVAINAYLEAKQKKTLRIAA